MENDELELEGLENLVDNVQAVIQPGTEASTDAPIQPDEV